MLKTKIIEGIRIAFYALYSNRMRSGLSILGIIIGVSAVMVLTTLGQGAKDYINNEFSGLGTNLIIIQPGKMEQNTSFPMAGIYGTKPLTIDDSDAVKRLCRTCMGVSPVIIGTSKVKYSNVVKNFDIFGVGADFPNIINVEIQTGHFFSEEDYKNRRKLCLIGYAVKEKIFGSINPLGKMIKIGNSGFRIIGVMVKKGNVLGYDMDNMVYISTTAAQRLFNTDRLFGIRTKARYRAQVEKAVEEVKKILLKRKRGEEDFSIMTQFSMMSTLDSIMNVLTSILVGIACISLVVGGIGIMNIMLVSVKERTREIGIRKAVGATKTDIIIQFLIESAILSATGGMAGYLLSTVGSLLIPLFINNFPVNIPLWSIFIALFFSSFVGVFFGVYPAYKAAKVNPIESLRYE